MSLEIQSYSSSLTFSGSRLFQSPGVWQWWGGVLSLQAHHPGALLSRDEDSEESHCLYLLGNCFPWGSSNTETPTTVSLVTPTIREHLSLVWEKLPFSSNFILRTMGLGFWEKTQKRIKPPLRWRKYSLERGRRWGQNIERKYEN